MKRFLSMLLLLCAVALLAAPAKARTRAKKSAKGKPAAVAIASKGEAVAVIAVDANAHRTVKYAASELQNYLRQITTARLAIRSELPGWKTSSIVLGTVDSPLVKKVIGNSKANYAKKLKYDGYGVYVSGNRIVIYAKTPRGVLNGVHRFIYKHTDFIWVRPLKEQAIYTQQPDLKLNVKSYYDNPVFRVRAWSANNNIAYHSEEFEMYISRLCNNLTPHPHPSVLDRQLDHGFLMEYGRGHNFSTIWLPKKKFGKTNPEFYMLNNGERRTTGRVQLCYSNRKMWDAFVKNSLEVIAGLPKYYARVNMLIDDTNVLCDCAECHKPITLPDGKILKDNDPAFRSTQFFIFMNYVAQKVYEKFPNEESSCDA